MNITSQRKEKQNEYNISKKNLKNECNITKKGK